MIPVRWRLPLILALLAVTLVYRALVIDAVFVRPGITGNENVGLITAPASEGVLVAGIAPLGGDRAPSAAARSGLLPGDRIVAAYDAAGTGHEVRSLFDLGRAMRRVDHLDAWRVEVMRMTDAGELRALTIEIPGAGKPAPTARMWLARIGYHVWLPLLGILAGAFLGLARPKDEHAFIASMMFLCFSSLFYERLLAFPAGTGVLALLHRTTAAHLTPYFFMAFFLTFPSPSLVERKLPWLRPAALALTAVGWAANLVSTIAAHTSFAPFATAMAAINASAARTLVDLLGVPLMAALVVIGALSLALNLVHEPTRQGRRRLALLLAGTLGLAPIFIFAVLESLDRAPGVWFYVVMAALLGLFPLSFVTVVIRHQVFGIRLIIRRGLQYALVSRGVVAVELVVFFLLLANVLGPILERFVPNVGPAPTASLTGLVALGLVLALRVVNRRLMRLVDRAFFRDAYNARRILIDLSRAVRQLTARPGELLEVVSAQVLRSLHPDGVAILLRDRPWPFACATALPTGTAGDPEPTGAGRFFLCLLQRPGDATPLPAESFDAPLVFEARLAPFFDALRTTEPRALEVWPEAWQSTWDREPSAAIDRVVAPGHAGPEMLALWETLETRLVVPLVSGGDVLGMLALGGKRSEEPYSGEDKELLLSVAEQAAIALDYAKLVGQAAEQERLRREIEIARDVQAQLLPQHKPAMSTLRYEGVCRPARGIGGDYFDYLVLDRGRLGIALGDVAGKGVSAALLMAGLQAALRSHAPRQGDRLSETVGAINRLLCDSMDRNRFATFFYGVYDDDARSLTYVNAGHNPPLVVRGANGGGAGASEIARLGPHDLVLGLDGDVSYSQHHFAMQRDDVLLVFSDGLTEAVDAAGNDFGEARLIDLAVNYRHLEAPALCARILDEASVFTGDAAPHDDLTLIVAKVV